MNVVGMLQSQKHVHFILEDFTHSEKVLFCSTAFREMERRVPKSSFQSSGLSFWLLSSSLPGVALTVISYFLK